jgi:hypothetical protein
VDLKDVQFFNVRNTIHAFLAFFRQIAYTRKCFHFLILFKYSANPVDFLGTITDKNGEPLAVHEIFDKKKDMVSLWKVCLKEKVEHLFRYYALFHISYKSRILQSKASFP